MRTEEAFVFSMPCMVKAISSTNSGERKIRVEASNEIVDSEGDIILQSALLESKDLFLRQGWLDLDHLASGTIGERLGIKNKQAFIIGRPLSVVGTADKRTLVDAELFKSMDGSFDPKTRVYDWVWEMINDPKINVGASIYGIPLDVETGTGGASRYLVKKMRWLALALTKNPVNQNLKTMAHIMTEKAFAKSLIEPRENPWNKSPYHMFDDAATDLSARGMSDIPENDWVRNQSGGINSSSIWHETNIDQLWETYISARLAVDPHLRSKATLLSIMESLKSEMGLTGAQAEIAAKAVMYEIISKSKRLGKR